MNFTVQLMRQLFSENEQKVSNVNGKMGKKVRPTEDCLYQECSLPCIPTYWSRKGDRSVVQMHQGNGRVI